MDDDTEVFYSCSATLNDELFVFGGYNTSNNKRKQVPYCKIIQKYTVSIEVSKVVDCGLKRIGDLSYDFILGACGTFFFPQERIILCFSQSYPSKCERQVICRKFPNIFNRVLLILLLSYDGSIFHSHADSKNGHHATTLANIEGSPLAVGGMTPQINKAETYDIGTNTWTEVSNYPYHDQ